MTNSNINRLALIVAVVLLLWAWFGPNLFGAPAPVVPLAPAPPSFMHFSAAEWAMIIGAIGLVVSNWRTGNKTQQVVEKQAKSEVKLEQIHELTNSNLSAVKAEMKALATKLEASIAANAVQQTTIQDLKVQREKIAEIAVRAADTIAHPATAPAPPTGSTINVDTVTAKTVQTENLEVKDKPKT